MHFFPQTSRQKEPGNPQAASTPTFQGGFMKLPKIESIAIQKIVPSPYQTRKDFNEEGLRGLAATLKEHGLLNAIVVRKVGEKYELIAGERRVRAAKTLGWTSIE